MTDRDRLAADLDEWLSAADDEWTVGEAAEFLAALGWTRLDAEAVAVLQKALVIGSISHDGDGWYAKEAGFDYDDAEATLVAARRILESLAEAYREDEG